MNTDIECRGEPPLTAAWLRGLLAVAILSQIATLLITFTTWQVRTSPPNLPLFDLPQIPLLWLILIFVSAIAPWWLGKRGSWIHLAVLICACLWDQFRIQPQFYFGWVFIFAATSVSEDSEDEKPSKLGLVVCRWALISLWFWAGFHKLISPEWLTYRSFFFMVKMVPQGWAENYHFVFAVVVGASEVGLAVLALVKPRLASWFCILLHVGIVLSLLLANWNYSVIPWNLMAAVFGFFLLRRHSIGSFDWQSIVVGSSLMLMPALFYVGQVDRAFAHVLYSGMTPSGLISHTDAADMNRLKPRLEKVHDWVLAVPFPNERRTVRQYFELTAETGSKLFLRDPRLGLSDQYFLRTSDGSLPISKYQFYSAEFGSVMGIAHDYYLATYMLDKKEVRRLKRSNDEMVYALEFSPENYSSELLKQVAGYPNLEQVQLSGCDVKDEDLRALSGLFRLEGIGLQNTAVSVDGLKYLEELPQLRFVEVKGTKITQEELTAFLKKLGGGASPRLQGLVD